MTDAVYESGCVTTVLDRLLSVLRVAAGDGTSRHHTPDRPLNAPKVDPEIISSELDDVHVT